MTQADHMPNTAETKVNLPAKPTPEQIAAAVELGRRMNIQTQVMQRLGLYQADSELVEDNQIWQEWDQKFSDLFRGSYARISQAEKDDSELVAKITKELRGSVH